MADIAQPGAAQDGSQQRGGEVDQSAEEPPTGGLTAVLGKLRDAAAAHDDELGDSGDLAQHG